MSEPTSQSRLNLREYPKDSNPVMSQKWRNLLFLHWEIDADEIQKTLPKGLYVDKFQGKAYIGIVPFFMQDVKIKLIPFMPALPNFLETNVRTYVYDENGIPGVWFYSLDANNFLVVQTARTIYNLPYFQAEMESSITSSSEIYYKCKRNESEDGSEFTYKGTNPSVEAPVDSLEFFLTERYVLYADKGENNLARGRVHHTPYPLQKAAVSKWDDKLITFDGLSTSGKAPDHILFSSGVDVDIFSLEDIS